MIKTLDDVREYRKLLPVVLDDDENPTNYETAVWCASDEEELYDYPEGIFLGDVYKLLRNTTSVEDRVEIWHFWLDAQDFQYDDLADLKKTMGYVTQEEE